MALSRAYTDLESAPTVEPVWCPPLQTFGDGQGVFSHDVGQVNLLSHSQDPTRLSEHRCLVASGHFR
jgi:hypothetical protein